MTATSSIAWAGRITAWAIMPGRSNSSKKRSSWCRRIRRSTTIWAMPTGRAGACRRGGIDAGAALHLDKRLPAAGGIGGGSSDAAAALRALSHLWGRPLDDKALAALALELGADVPACLAARPVWVGGIGEEIEPAAFLPAPGIVLANPRRPLPTADVFRRRAGPFSSAARFQPVPADAAGLVAALTSRHNDLTEAAVAVAPEIGAVLDRLAALPGALLARMSGSGATCFALFADRAAALAVGRALAAAEPGWWTAARALLTVSPALEETGAP